MKRVLAALLIAVFSVTMLAACGEPQASNEPSTASENTAAATATNTADAEKEVTLRITWWGSQTRHDRTLQVLDLYTSQHPNVKFQPEFMGFDEYWKKLNTLVAANNVPDVFQMGNNFLTYGEHLEPLDSYIDSGAIDISQASEAFLMPGTVNGKLLGIPLGINALTVIYDPAMFTKAGIPLPTENWTWDDYTNASEKLKSQLGVYNCGTQSPFWVGLATYVPQHGDGNTAFTDSADALGYSDDKILADYFALNQKLIKEGVQPGPSELASIKDLEGEFVVSEKAGMAWLNSNQLTSVFNAAKRELALAVPPRLTADGPSGLHAKPTHHISIGKSSPNKEESARFINFILNDMQANEIIGGERGTSIMKNVREHMMTKLTDVDKLGMEYIDLVSRIASNGPPREPVGQMEIESELTTIFEELSFDMITPEDAAAKFRTKAEAIFKRTATN